MAYDYIDPYLLHLDVLLSHRLPVWTMFVLMLVCTPCIPAYNANYILCQCCVPIYLAHAVTVPKVPRIADGVMHATRNAARTGADVYTAAAMLLASSLGSLLSSSQRSTLAQPWLFPCTSTATLEHQRLNGDH